MAVKLFNSKVFKFIFFRNSFDPKNFPLNFDMASKKSKDKLYIIFKNSKNDVFV